MLSDARRGSSARAACACAFIDEQALGSKACRLLPAGMDVMSPSKDTTGPFSGRLEIDMSDNKLAEADGK